MVEFMQIRVNATRKPNATGALGGVLSTIEDEEMFDSSYVILYQYCFLINKTNC